MTRHTTQSTAVMQRRHEPPDSLDYFPTPPWATRALLEHVIVAHSQWSTGLAVRDATDSVWDPACGERHMAQVFDEYFESTFATDIFDYGGNDTLDFRHPNALQAAGVDWVITNPPFNGAVDFIQNGLKVARKGVAMLVRSAFLETSERYQVLFSQRPPQMICQYVERVPMHRGRWVVNGSTATSYCWLVWKRLHEVRAPSFLWIPPSRTQLTRHDDWLRFGGCVDVPKEHMSAQILRLHAGDPDAPRRDILDKVAALRGMAA